jgi:hypothetical protein
MKYFSVSEMRSIGNRSTTVSMDNLFFVDLAEEIAKDRPHSRTVADRALQRTHRCLPWLTELWNVTPERAKGRPVAALSNLRY